MENLANKSDFKVQFFRGSGPGGQHRNKKDTACRIIHIETGLFAESQEHKSQNMNKKAAFKKLANKLIKHFYPDLKVDRYKTTEVIRTYHEPRGTVKDHRTGNIYNYDKVLNGELEQLIKDHGGVV